MFLFHSHVLLRKSDEATLITSDEKLQLKQYFFNLLKTEQSLPAEFCLEIFFKYLMYDEALSFLFYRKEYHQLLELIHQQIKNEN